MSQDTTRPRLPPKSMLADLLLLASCATLGLARFTRSDCADMALTSFRGGGQAITTANGDVLYGVYQRQLLRTPTTAADVRGKEGHGRRVQPVAQGARPRRRESAAQVARRVAALALEAT